MTRSVRPLVTPIVATVAAISVLPQITLGFEPRQQTRQKVRIADDGIESSSSSDFEARRLQYVEEHTTLTAEEYRLLFNGSCDQTTSKDCYLLVALGSIPMSLRESLFRTSIKIEPRGLLVSFPMGVSDPDETILVRRSDLRPQVKFFKGTRKLYRPVNSSNGWKALEAAYILSVHGRDKKSQVDRESAGGGKAWKVLNRIVKTDESAFVSVYEAPSISANARDVERATATLDTFDPDVHMLSLSSRNDSSTRDYLIDGVTFCRKHAYVVAVVDKSARTLTLVNPHDSTRPLIVSYNLAFKAFDAVYRVTLDTEATFR